MSNQQLETKIQINADASQARNEVGKFEAGFSRTLKEMGKSTAEAKAIRTLAREIREGAKSTDELDQETRDLVTTYNKLRSIANDRNLLGVRSHEKVRAEIAKVELAYKRLKTSGQLSSRELAQAAAATKQKVKALRGEMDVTAKRTSKLSGALGGLRSVFGGLLAGLGIQQLIQTNREFETMRASLETVTGSADNAAQAFAAIQEFSAKTPYSVGEITTAFTKLTALGLQPSERALTSYGNTASAMGKSLDQMIEAVADATTGEFERLKEFGIKARSEGDKVSLTFRGTTTTIGKNAKEIEDYLTSIGEVEFAGGMDRQMQTLNGSISNLGDAWSKLMDNMLNEGGSSALSGMINGVSDALNWVATDGIAHFQGAVVAGIATVQNAFTQLGGSGKIIWAGIEAAGEGAVNILKERVSELTRLMADGFDKVGADKTAASWRRLSDSIAPTEGAYEKFQRRQKEINDETEREIQIRNEAATATIQSIQADKDKLASLDKLAKSEKAAAAEAEKVASAYKKLGIDSSTSIQQAGAAIVEAFRQIVESGSDGVDTINSFDAALKKTSDAQSINALRMALYDAFSAGQISGDAYLKQMDAVDARLAAIGETVTNSAEAFAHFGLTSSEQLQAIADKSLDLYTVLEQSGKATTEQMEKAFLQYAQESIAAQDGVIEKQLEVKAATLGLTSGVQKLATQFKETGKFGADAMRDADQQAKAFQSTLSEINRETSRSALMDMANDAARSWREGAIGAKEYSQIIDEINKRRSELVKLTDEQVTAEQKVTEAAGKTADEIERQASGKASTTQITHSSGSSNDYAAYTYGPLEDAKRYLDKELQDQGLFGLSTDANSRFQELLQNPSPSTIRTEESHAGYLKSLADRAIQDAKIAERRAAEKEQAAKDREAAQQATASPGKTITMVFRTEKDGVETRGLFAEDEAMKFIRQLETSSLVVRG